MVVLVGGAVSYERGTPVGAGIGLRQGACSSNLAWINPQPPPRQPLTLSRIGFMAIAPYRQASHCPPVPERSHFETLTIYNLMQGT